MRRRRKTLKQLSSVLWNLFQSDGVFCLLRRDKRAETSWTNWNQLEPDVKDCATALLTPRLMAPRRASANRTPSVSAGHGVTKEEMRTRCQAPGPKHTLEMHH